MSSYDTMCPLFSRVVYFHQNKKRRRPRKVGLIMVKTSVLRISIPLDLSSRSFIPISFHPFVSSHTVFTSFPRTLTSTSFLSGTCWGFILVFHYKLAFVVIIVLVWHFVTLSFPWPSTFFIPMKINIHTYNFQTSPSKTCATHLRGV